MALKNVSCTSGKVGKRQIMDRIELPNQLGKNENYKYLEILEAAIIKQVEMKEKIRKEFRKRTGKFLETKLCRNHIK